MALFPSTWDGMLFLPHKTDVQEYFLIQEKIGKSKYRTMDCRFTTWKDLDGFKIKKMQTTIGTKKDALK